MDFSINGLAKRMRKVLQMLAVVLLTAFLTLGNSINPLYVHGDEDENENDYATYRPMREGELGFEELQNINPEVFGWINIFGTNINYPLVQDGNGDNRRYEHINARGEPSMAGAIFLDVRNSNDLTDFNNIIYGHDMARNTMFGEIGSFANEDVFESRQYGMLFTGETFYGLELFAFLLVDAYDTGIYAPNMTDPAEKQLFIDRIFNEAIQFRDIDITINDRLVLLSTCTPTWTNGRHILVGRLVEEVPEDVFLTGGTRSWGAILLDEVGELGLATGSFLVIVLTICITLLIVRIQGRKEEEDLKAIPPRIKKKQPTLLGEILLLSSKIAMVLSAFALLFIFLFGATQVSDASMAPSVREGDIVFFQRIGAEVSVGSNVVVRYGGQTQVRRVVAVAGDEVDITADGLVLNGIIQIEMHIFEETTQFVEGINFPLVVPYGEVFVLGDSRRSAQDSRIYDTVPIDDILGSVVSVVRRRNL